VRQVALGTVLRRLLLARSKHSPAQARQALLLVLRHIAMWTPTLAPACRDLEGRVERKENAPDARAGELLVLGLLANATNGEASTGAFYQVQAVEVALKNRTDASALAHLVPLCRRLERLLPDQRPPTLAALAALEGIVGGLR